MKPGSVPLSVSKLNGSKIAPNVTISVSPADFSSSNKQQSQQQGNGDGEGDEGSEDEDDDDEDEDDYDEDEDGEDEENEGGGEQAALDSSLFDDEGVPMFQPLPHECKGSHHPTVVLRNLYTTEEVRLVEASFSTLMMMGRHSELS